MKKQHKILILFLVIIALCGSLVWWQWGNIQALYYWSKYSDSDIDKLMDNSFSEVESYLEENPQYQVRPYNPIEGELHQAGIINDEELISLLTEQTTIEEMFGTELELTEDKKITIVESGEQIDIETVTKLKQDAPSLSQSLNQPDTVEPPQNNSKTENSQSDNKDKSSQNTNSSSANNKSEVNLKPDNNKTEKPVQTTPKEETSKPSDKKENNNKPENIEVSECIAQVYVIKSKFVSELDIIYNAAFSEYKALWHDMTDEQRTAKKKSLLSEVYPKASALERDCDTQINQLLTKLSKLLKDSGESTTLADQIRDSYYNEKSLKKAHYLSLLT